MQYYVRIAQLSDLIIKICIVYIWHSTIWFFWIVQNCWNQKFFSVHTILQLFTHLLFHNLCSFTGTKDDLWKLDDNM